MLSHMKMKMDERQFTSDENFLKAWENECVVIPNECGRCGL